MNKDPFTMTPRELEALGFEEVFFRRARWFPLLWSTEKPIPIAPQSCIRLYGRWYLQYKPWPKHQFVQVNPNA